MLILEVSLERGSRANKRGNTDASDWEQVRAQCTQGITVINGPQRDLLRFVCTMSSPESPEFSKVLLVLRNIWLSTHNS